MYRFRVIVYTPNGQTGVIVHASHQQEAVALVKSMYAALMVEDRRYVVKDYAEPL